MCSKCFCWLRHRRILLFYDFGNNLCYSLGDGYLRKSLLPPGVHPMGTAKDLTFVSVLDKDGRPLRQASTVEVWNTKKNNIKTYPIINGSTYLFLCSIILESSTNWAGSRITSFNLWFTSKDCTFKIDIIWTKPWTDFLLPLHCSWTK